MIGTKLAHYYITARLGSGGMGDVYEATAMNAAETDVTTTSNANLFIGLSNE
jgi:hypothetical protein